MTKKKEILSETAEKSVAGVCGLYCKACTLYIATQEDPERLKVLAERFQISEEEIKCFGCRSSKRGPYCSTCKMTACASEKEIDFCFQCTDYPCDELKQFQSERPHRIELWKDLDQIKNLGYEHWLDEIPKTYSCPECKTINSAYDLLCRTCGNEPGCEFVANHKQAIEQILKTI